MEKRQASEPIEKPEVTPEMISAGVHELACFDPVEDSWATRAGIVKEIYSAMARLTPSDKSTNT